MNSQPRILQEGTCEVCHTECTREKGTGTWYNFYGRSECRLARDDGIPHAVPVWRETIQPPRKIPPSAEITLVTADGKTITQQVFAGQVYSETLPGPVTITGMRLTVHAGKVIP